jgi:hypothetical protein
MRDPVANLLHNAGRLVAEQEWKIVVDATLPVVEIGVTDSACLDANQRLSRSRIRDADPLHGNGGPFRLGDNSANLVTHGTMYLLADRILYSN